MLGETQMDDLERYVAKRSQENPSFAETMKKTEAEYEVMRLIANARSEKGMTQKELAAACGLKQSNISRLECGTTSPTLKTLEQLAAGLGKKLRISFI